MKSLPQTGTAALLETLSPHLDDDVINDLFPRRRGRGRRRLFSAAQLFRVLLLNLVTPVHSFNLLVQLLAENRSWRTFAHLPNQRTLPDAKMLHLFRDRLDLSKLRAINHHLWAPILAGLDPSRKSVAIMDATDLPAATNSFKKRIPATIPPIGRWWAGAPSRADKAGGSSATRNILCGCGCRSARKRSCWFP
jgi:hypothetical protein